MKDLFGGSLAVQINDDWPFDFEQQFWNQYPRRQAKIAAMKALSRVRKRGDVPWQHLIVAVMRYAALVQGKDQKFTKLPATWLNAGCWDDEPDHALPRPLSFMDIARGFGDGQ